MQQRKISRFRFYLLAVVTTILFIPFFVDDIGLKHKKYQEMVEKSGTERAKITEVTSLRLNKVDRVYVKYSFRANRGVYSGTYETTPEDWKKRSDKQYIDVYYLKEKPDENSATIDWDDKATQRPMYWEITLAFFIAVIPALVLNWILASILKLFPNFTDPYRPS